MRTTTDAIRSAKKYLSLVLGEEWSIFLADERGEFSYPAAVVQAVDGGGANTSGPAIYAEVTLPMHISCFPMDPDASERPTEAEARLVAEGVRESLVQAVRVGVGEGRPERIPLYDYEGVALDQASTAREPSDFMRVLDFSAALLPDAEDARNVAVVCDMRVNWRRAGRVVRGARPVHSVRVRADVR